MRLLNDHIVNPANDRLTVSVIDEPGAGGANHLYIVSGFNTESNASAHEAFRHGHKTPRGSMAVLFQNGPIPEKGVNGITHEVLLAIVADRLRSFQAGPYNCVENYLALMHIEAAQKALQARTRARMARGVEGTHTV